MKMLLSIIAMLILAPAAMADSSAGVSDGSLISESSVDRDMFYCQSPFGTAMNGSSAFEAELADDIPTTLDGQLFNLVGGWCLQWGAAWQNPMGITINIYSGDCPPGMVADYSYYFAWADLYSVYDPQGGWDTYYFEALLPVSHTITAGMSIGFVAEVGWGQNAPYAGFAMSDPVMGCGSAYWAGDYWGYPRWYSAASYGYPYDVAYCLGTDGIPVGESTWSAVKALY